MGLLFIKTSPVKQYLYENDFSGVFDALHQSFLVVIRSLVTKDQVKVFATYFIHFSYTSEICQMLI